jgi:hypothetical protein
MAAPLHGQWAQSENSSDWHRLNVCSRDELRARPMRLPRLNLKGHCTAAPGQDSGLGSDIRGPVQVERTTYTSFLVRCLRKPLGSPALTRPGLPQADYRGPG